MNCVLYARVSTDKQADKELSLPAQLQAMRDYARSRDWTVVEEFVESGASARTAERPELKRLLARCARAQPSDHCARDREALWVGARNGAGSV